MRHNSTFKILLIDINACIRGNECKIETKITNTLNYYSKYDSLKRDSAEISKFVTSYRLVYTTSRLFYFPPKMFLFLPAASPAKIWPIREPVLHHPIASTRPSGSQYCTIREPVLHHPEASTAPSGSQYYTIQETIFCQF